MDSIYKMFYCIDYIKNSARRNNIPMNDDFGVIFYNYKYYIIKYVYNHKYKYNPYFNMELLVDFNEKLSLT